MFTIIHKLFVLIPCLLGVLVDAYPEPGNCTGACWAHDPSVMQRASDGAYFRFSTGGGIQIWKSLSIVGPWIIEGYVMPNGSSIDLVGNTDLWAPDVHLVDNVYYLYYAISTFGTPNSAIGVATSTTMEAGSWTDHGTIGLTSNKKSKYNTIDPNLIEVAGAYHLNFGSFYGDIYQVEMSVPPLSISKAAPYNLAYNTSGSHAEEGSYMFYYDDYYYLLISSGLCCNYNVDLPAPGAEYKIIMCRSTTVNGIFVDQSGKDCTKGGGTTLLASHDYVYGPGGQGVYNDTSLGLVLYYHYADKNEAIGDGDYLFGWNQLTWLDGWPSLI